MCPAPAHITITNSTDSDIDEIFRLYRLATDYQKTQGAVLWPQFDRALVEKEIGEKTPMENGYRKQYCLCFRHYFQ